MEAGSEVISCCILLEEERLISVYFIRGDHLFNFESDFECGTRKIGKQGLKLRFTIEQATKARKGSRGKALPFL